MLAKSELFGLRDILLQLASSLRTYKQESAVRI